MTGSLSSAYAASAPHMHAHTNRQPPASPWRHASGAMAASLFIGGRRVDGAPGGCPRDGVRARAAPSSASDQIAPRCRVDSDLRFWGAVTTGPPKMGRGTVPGIANLTYSRRVLKWRFKWGEGRKEYHLDARVPSVPSFFTDFLRLR